jgi:hypothetical protein
MIDKSRLMQEWKVGKDRYMQTYHYPDFATVVFFDGSRASTAIDPFFSKWAKPHPVCVFYTEVPYVVVEKYLSMV